MGRPSIRLLLSPREQAELAPLTRCYTAPYNLVVRAQIVLSVALGQSVGATAPRVGCHRHQVRKWVKRYRDQGLAGLGDQSRPGRPARFFPWGRHAPGEARV